MPKPQAAIYARISDDRTGEALGVQRQVEDCRKLAESLGWEVTHTLIENDTSAYSGRRRPQYEQLLNLMQDGALDGVLAWHSDRLHRRPIELEEYIHLAQAHHIVTHTVKGGEIDLATPEGMLRAGMLGQIARYESAHKSDRITRAHEQAARLGKWRGGLPPFGYSSDAMEIVEHEAQLIRDAYEHILTGGSVGQVVRDWNAAGVKTRNGKTWVYQTVVQVLLRSRNFGASEYRGEIVARNAFPAIVSEDDWLRLKALFMKRATGPSQERGLKYYLVGLAKCGVCLEEGRDSRVVTSNSNYGYKNYRCAVSHRHVSRKVDALNLFISELVIARLSRGDLHLEAPDVVDVSGDADKLRTKLNTYAGMLADDLMTADQFKRATAQTRAQLTELEAQLAKQKPVEAVRISEATDVRKAWEDLPPTKKRAVVDSLMEVVVLKAGRGYHRGIEPQHVRIVWRT